MKKYLFLMGWIIAFVLIDIGSQHVLVYESAPPVFTETPHKIDLERLVATRDQITCQLFELNYADPVLDTVIQRATSDSLYVIDHVAYLPRSFVGNRVEASNSCSLISGHSPIIAQYRERIRLCRQIPHLV